MHDPLPTMVLLDALWTLEPRKEMGMHDLKVESYIRRFEREAWEAKRGTPTAIHLAARVGLATSPGDAEQAGRPAAGRRLTRWSRNVLASVATWLTARRRNAASAGGAVAG